VFVNLFQCQSRHYLNELNQVRGRLMSLLEGAGPRVSRLIWWPRLSSNRTVTGAVAMGCARTAVAATTRRQSAGTRWTSARRSATCRGPRHHAPALKKQTEACYQVNVSSSTKQYAATEMCNPSGISGT
jgi:hypothetical protein